MSISFQSRVRISEGTLFQELNGEAVILGLSTEKYFGLDKVGTRMWTVLMESPSIEEACRALLAEYEVEEGELRRDLVGLVETLLEKKLVRLVEGEESLS